MCVANFIPLQIKNGVSLSNNKTPKILFKPYKFLQGRTTLTIIGKHLIQGLAYIDRVPYFS